MGLHYICRGTCGAMSLEPGICGSDSCPLRMQDFAECDCDDGEHVSASGLKLDDAELSEWEEKFEDGEVDFK